jgi:hypothetical protein
VWRRAVGVGLGDHAEQLLEQALARVRGAEAVVQSLDFSGQFFDLCRRVFAYGKYGIQRS